MDFSISSLPGKQILILGLGISGLSMARWCARHGAIVSVVDTRIAPPLLADLHKDFAEVMFQGCEPLDARLFLNAAYDAVFVSPGLTPAATAAVHDHAIAAGIAWGNELGLFAQALAGLQRSQQYAPQVIAITGSNGKTTVTALTGKLVERAGKSVATAGNIGPALLDTLAKRLEAKNLPDVWVLELSSFQLNCVNNANRMNAEGDYAGSNGFVFVPTVATVLNISQDHLDWHESMEAYIAAKNRVFGHSTQMLLNRDDPACMVALTLATDVVPSQAELPVVLPAKTQSRLRKSSLTVPAVERLYTSFGKHEPKRPGDWGIESVNGIDWLVRAEFPSVGTEGLVFIKARQRQSLSASQLVEPQKICLSRLMPMQALRIHGRHNATNALAALALATAVGCTLAPMLHGLREYRGEPHRVESVAVVDGVEFFDDSKGTNVGATVAALEGLTVSSGRKLVLILGGDGKGQDFSPLRNPVASCCRAVVLIGRDAALIVQALQPDDKAPAFPVPIKTALTLPQAVLIAASLAQVGDAVLLSPACASFDMFEGYEHRAAVFCAAVRDLALKKGSLV